MRIWKRPMQGCLYLVSVFAFLFGVTSCSKANKVWIVVHLQMTDGTTSEMSFDNPAVPDITLQECKDSLDTARPTLLDHIGKVPRFARAVFVSSECVESAVDPIEPK
jgi:hypothetical protein